MDHEFQDIEDSLKGLRPAKPDAACLDRLLSAVEGRLQKNDLSITGIESRLAAMQPMAPAPETFARMMGRGKTSTLELVNGDGTRRTLAP